MSNILNDGGKKPGQNGPLASFLSLSPYIGHSHVAMGFQEEHTSAYFSSCSCYKLTERLQGELTSVSEGFPFDGRMAKNK